MLHDSLNNPAVINVLHSLMVQGLAPSPMPPAPNRRRNQARSQDKQRLIMKLLRRRALTGATIAEIATALGCSASSAHYQIHKLEAAGELLILRESYRGRYRLRVLTLGPTK